MYHTAEKVECLRPIGTDAPVRVLCGGFVPEQEWIAGLLLGNDLLLTFKMFLVLGNALNKKEAASG